MKRIFALLVTSIVASACGNGGPLAPTAPASSTGAFTVSGVVVDGDGGQPLRGARVVVSSGIDSYMAHSDSGGFYSIQGIPSGLWSVTVSKTGYETESIDADVSSDITLAFRLRRGPSEPTRRTP